MQVRSQYEAITLMEGVSFSRQFDIFPLTTVLPIADRRYSVGIAQTMDSVLASAGWSARLGEPWIADEDRKLPIFVLHSGLPGANLDEVYLHASLLAGLVSDVVALHRGAAATPIVTVVEEVTAATRPRPYLARSHRPDYHGNLLTGPLSGEDPAAIAADIAAASKDTLSMLWLRIARQARVEQNPDFAMFRWWSLLEAIADASSPSTTTHVTDFSGAAILKDDSKQLDTSSSHGRVLAFLKQFHETNNLHESSYVMNPPFGSLWETVFAWCGMRNAVAHYGRFDPSNVDQQGWWWFPYVSAARQHELTLAPGGAAYMLHSLRDLTTMVLRREVHRRDD